MHDYEVIKSTETVGKTRSRFPHVNSYWGSNLVNASNIIFIHTSKLITIRNMIRLSWER